MDLKNPEVKRLAHEAWQAYCQEYARLERRQLEQFNGYFRDFLEDLLNYPLTRPWRESLDLFQEHYWEQMGMRLTSDSYRKVATLIEQLISNPRCGAHGPIRPEPGATASAAPRPLPVSFASTARESVLSPEDAAITAKRRKDLQYAAGRIAAAEQRRIDLSDDERAQFEYYIFTNFLRAGQGRTALPHPQFWHDRNNAFNARRGWRPIGPSSDASAMKMSAPTVSAPAEKGPSRTDQDPPRVIRKPEAQVDAAGKSFFERKLAEARGHLDQIERRLEALGGRLDAAAIDQAIDVESDADQVEELIWRYNDALESAGDEWLRKDLPGDALRPWYEMPTPISFGLPQFLDDAQAERGRHQGLLISQRLGRRDLFMNRFVKTAEWTEFGFTVAGFLVGGGLAIKAVAQGGKWVVAKIIVGAVVSAVAEQAAEAGLRAAGASQQTIRGVRLAVAVVMFILLRRKGAATRSSAAAAPTARTTRGIWDLSPEARWTAVEQRLGKNLAGNFKTIDKFDRNGIATSIKSLDLRAKSYANPTSLERRVRGYIDDVAKYRGGKWNRVIIDPEQVRGRVLELAVPPDGTDVQRGVLKALVEFGKQRGVVVTIVEMW